MDGDHDIETMAYHSEKMLSHTFRYLNMYDVILEGILLKPNMVLAGADSGKVRDSC
jgi:fructose-bisphosphate aldolase, class I